MSANSKGRLGRRALVAQVLAERGETLAVAGLGSPAWDLMAAGDRAENYYLWAGMGQAAPIGLGLALARPERRVLVVTGDGEMMMGIGSLAVIAAQAPTNLAILVLDNEQFSETGGQSGLTAVGTDIAAIARGAGIGTTRFVTDEVDVPELTRLLLHVPGPVVATAKVAEGEDEVVYPTQDGALLADRMRAALGVT